jgi:hydrogenase expression/formation protein HypC
MCVGVPAQVLSLTDGVMPMARLAMAGAELEVCIAYLPEAAVGDWVLVQNGFAVAQLDEASAAESLAAFAELGALPRE